LITNTQKRGTKKGEEEKLCKKKPAKISRNDSRGARGPEKTTHPLRKKRNK